MTVMNEDEVIQALADIRDALVVARGERRKPGILAEPEGDLFTQEQVDRMIVSNRRQPESRGCPGWCFCSGSMRSRPGPHWRADGAALALNAMVEMVLTWTEDAKVEHKANGHRKENIGKECWRTWGAGDLARMIDEVARETMGVHPYVDTSRLTTLQSTR